MEIKKNVETDKKIDKKTNKTEKIEKNEKIVLMILIIGRNKKDAILTALLDANIHLINTAYGRGTVSAGYLTTVLGLVPEKNKAVITCVSTCVKIDSVLKMLNERFHFDKPNTGIAFTIPIDGLSF